MKIINNIFDFQNINDDCIKCGKCIPTCTIYQINPDETTSPRGFINLLGEYKKGNLELDLNAKNIFESCFLCTNCVEICPNSLPTDMIIEEVRIDIAKKFGISWFKKAFFILLKYRILMDIFSKMGFIFKSCALKEDVKGRGLKARFSLPFIKKGRLLPSMARTSFLNSYPENIITEKIIGEKKLRVAIFIGCLANYNYKETGDGLVKILKKLNIDIFIPKKQLCCGAPAYFTGDIKTVKFLIEKNIKYFETFIDDCDAILIPEATCSALIKHDWEIISENHNLPDLKKRIKKIKDKIFMATEWLNNYTNLEDIVKRNNNLTNKKITYHDPCHAKKVQNIYKEPRNLLSKLYKLEDMSDSDRCCGFGGVTMQTEKFKFAELAGVPKAVMIEETKADYVSAECSACRVQLSEAMSNKKVETIFKHPLELIAERI